MPGEQPSFIELLQKRILPNVQRLALLLAFVGLVFSTLHYTGAQQLLLIGFSTLSMTYFLMAFIPMHIPVDCKPALYTSILYKVIYIGSSVNVIGLMFYLLKLNGATEIMQIGIMTLGFALVTSGFLAIKQRDNWVVLKDAIIRGVGLLLLSIYFMREAFIQL